MNRTSKTKKLENGMNFILIKIAKSNENTLSGISKKELIEIGNENIKKCAKYLQTVADMTQNINKHNNTEGEMFRLLGECYYRLYKETDNYNYLEMCQEVFSTALKFIINAGNAQLLHKVSIVYYEYGVYSGALQIESTIITRFPTYEFLPNIIFEAAIILKYLKQYRKSIDYLQHLSTKIPYKLDEQDYYMALARTLEESNNPKNTRLYKATFENKIRDETRYHYSRWEEWYADEKTWFYYGKSFMKLRYFTLAMDFFLEALKRSDKPSDELYFKLGTCSAKSFQKQFAELCLNNLKDESLHKQLAHLLNIVDNPEPVEIDKDSTQNNSDVEDEQLDADEEEPNSEYDVEKENEESDNDKKANEDDNYESNDNDVSNQEETQQSMTTSTENLKSDEIQPVSSVNEANEEKKGELDANAEDDESRDSVSTIKSDDERFTEDILNIKRKFTRVRSPLIDNTISSSSRSSRISILSQFSPMKHRKSTMVRKSKLSTSSTPEVRRSRLAKPSTSKLKRLEERERDKNYKAAMSAIENKRKQIAAATNIQRVYRGYKTRLSLSAFGQAQKIFKSIKRAKRQIIACSTIQRVWRGHRVRKQVRSQMIERRKLRKKLYHSALLIQTKYRGYHTRKNYKLYLEFTKAAIKIQSIVRRHNAKKLVQYLRSLEKAEYESIQNAATSFQRLWRGYSERFKADQLFSFANAQQIRIGHYKPLLPIRSFKMVAYDLKTTNWKPLDQPEARWWGNLTGFERNNVLIDGVTITNNDASIITDLLPHSEFLHTLAIGEGTIDDKGIRRLSQGLKSCFTIEAIAFAKNMINEVGMNNLIETLRCYTYTPQTLLIEDNPLGDASLKLVERYLSDYLVTRFAKIQMIVLNRCRITDLGFIKFVPSLKTYQRLTCIGFSGNEIGDKGLRKLSKALPYCPFLTEIDLSSNRITSKGIIPFCNGILRNTSLQIINLTGNMIGRVGGRAVINVYHILPKYSIKINMKDNPIPHLTMKILDLIFQSCPIEYPVDTTKGSVTKYLLPPYLRPPQSNRDTAGKILFKEVVKKKKKFESKIPLEITLDSSIFERSFSQPRKSKSVRTSKRTSQFRVIDRMERQKAAALLRQSVINNRKSVNSVKSVKSP